MDGLRWSGFAVAMVLGLGSPGWAASEVPAGVHDIRLHARDGTQVLIGKVDFRHEGAVATFALDIDRAVFTDYFLSMREFKCLKGDNELQCRVPYPYSNPRTLPGGDPVWLEHALLFFYKPPDDFGANLRNGVIYTLERTADGYAGTSAIIDLNDISGPPDDPAEPPFPRAIRFEGSPEDRWFPRLTVDKRAE